MLLAHYGWTTGGDAARNYYDCSNDANKLYPYFSTKNFHCFVIFKAHMFSDNGKEKLDLMLHGKNIAELEMMLVTTSLKILNDTLNRCKFSDRCSLQAMHLFGYSLSRFLYLLATFGKIFHYLCIISFLSTYSHFFYRGVRRDLSLLLIVLKFLLLLRFSKVSSNFAG